MKLFVFLLLSLCSLAIQTCFAQGVLAPVAPPTTLAPTPVVAPAVIEDVYRSDWPDPVKPKGWQKSDEAYQKARQSFEVDDTLMVKLSQVDFIKDQSSVDLYLDNKKVASFDPKIYPVNNETKTLEFVLTYGVGADESEKSTNKKNWAALLSAPTWDKFWRRPVSLSVGTDHSMAVHYKDRVILKRIDDFRFWTSVAVGVVILAILLWSNLLKKILREALSDSGPMPFTGGFKPWSLARSQMAFWSVLIAVSFLSIWVINGALDTITASVLTLMGIGSGSALGSAFIDASKDAGALSEKLKQRKSDIGANIDNLTIEIAKVEQQKLQKLQTLGVGDFKALQNQLSDLTDKEAKNILTAVEQTSLALARSLFSEVDALRQSSVSLIQQKTTQAKLADFINNNINNETNGFWADILYDKESAAFHRIQMVVWTLILGVVFIDTVWKTLAMPDFSDTLLALQGISAGTYLGFKIPDKA